VAYSSQHQIARGLGSKQLCRRCSPSIDVMENIRALYLSDAHIAFWDVGDGDPVLLVHASFGAEWFAPVARLLSGYRVVRTHRAGYGHSRDLDGKLSLVDHARHLAEVLRALSIERVHVVGHSSGGSTALQLAADYPALVQSMVLLEPAFPYAPDEPKNDAMRHAIQAAKEDDLERAFRFFPGSVCGAGYRRVLIRTLGAEGFEASIRSGRYFFDHEISALAAWNSDAAHLETLAPPTLLVEGEGERLYNPYRARNASLARRLPNVERLSIPDVSHAMPLENPTLIAQTILDFLSSHPLDPKGER
jgi:pimeloyl-ACP methyl ester carboxylesterase